MNIKDLISINKTTQGMELSYVHEYLGTCIHKHFIGYTKKQAINIFFNDMPIIASNGYIGIKDIDNSGDYVLTENSKNYKKLYYTKKECKPYFIQNNTRYYLENFFKVNVFLSEKDFY